MQACLEVLTSQQRKRWTELIGNPFEGERIYTRPRPQ